MADVPRDTPTPGVVIAADTTELLRTAGAAFEDLDCAIVSALPADGALRVATRRDIALVLLYARGAFAIAEAIREQEDGAPVPILVVTSLGPDHPDVQAAYRLGWLDVAHARVSGQALRARGVLAVELHRQRARAEALAEQVRGLEGANGEVGEMVARWRHDLRNPLSCISTGIVLLEDAAREDPSLARVCDVLRRQTDRLASLIDELPGTGRPSW